MPEHERLDRKSLERTAQEPLGVNRIFAPVWSVEYQATWEEVLAVTSGVNTQALRFLQNEAGQKYFVEGYSDPAGDDIMPPT